MTTATIADPTHPAPGSDDDYLALPIEERKRLRGDTDEIEDAPGGEPAPTSAAAAPSPAAEPQDDGAARGGQGIPRARFNEVNEARRLAESQLAERDRELAELQERLAASSRGAPAATPAPPAKAFDAQEAEEQYAQAMLDGDVKGAAALRLEINARIEEAAYARYSAAATSQQAASLAGEAVTGLLATYPWLDDPEGAAALELIEASVEHKIARGMPRHQALTEAAHAIAPRFAPTDTPAKGLPGNAPAVDTRLERADRRGATDAALQPAAVQAGMGNRATPAKVDATTLTDDEYMALPEAERKRIRGD